MKGVHRTEDELATLCKTTTEGTSAKGLIRAAKVVDPVWEPRVFSDKPDVGLLRLLACLRAGVPVILGVDSMDHWVTAVGLVGVDTVIVADPADEEQFLYLPPDDLLKRWSSGGKCFAIAVF